jgi:hypothetical protein
MINIRFIDTEGRIFTRTFKPYTAATDVYNEVASTLERTVCSFVLVYFGKILLQGENLAGRLRDGASMHVVNRFSGC